jgi:hypothetical protein
MHVHPENLYVKLGIYYQMDFFKNLSNDYEMVIMNFVEAMYTSYSRFITTYYGVQIHADLVKLMNTLQHCILWHVTYHDKMGFFDCAVSIDPDQIVI